MRRIADDPAGWTWPEDVARRAQAAGERAVVDVPPAPRERINMRSGAPPGYSSERLMSISSDYLVFDDGQREAPYARGSVFVSPPMLSPVRSHEHNITELLPDATNTKGGP
jgi:hypothetical protein